MTGTVNDKDIFDRNRRRQVRIRARRRTGDGGFLHQLMTDELLDRLSLVKREFQDCLVIGRCSDKLEKQLAQRGLSLVRADSTQPDEIGGIDVQCDEDRLPFADHSFDLVINIGTLDTVNDLPGALILSRRILRPDGFFLASFYGAESLPQLKSLIMTAERDRVAPHIHPQIDVRTAGDLLARAGMTLPVADSDSLVLRYSSLDKLLADIRDGGGSNVLNQTNTPIDRPTYDEIAEQFEAAKHVDGKFSERFELVFLCGWAPHPEQPKPARRGSGQASLSSVLKKK